MKKFGIAFVAAVAFFVFSVPVVCVAQTSGAGSMYGGLAKGGAGSTALAAKLGKVADKGVFNRIANRSKGIKTSKNNAPARQTPKTAKPKAGSNQPGSSSGSPDPGTLKFRPSGDIGTDRVLADLLTTNPDESAALLFIFSETKKAFDAEAAKTGRQNDLALAMTFFIVAGVTVSNDAPEPGDAATENLYKALSESMLESSEIAQMSDLDKQTASETLVYVSGLILSGYAVSKENEDEESLGLFRQIAATFLNDLTGIPAEKMEFDASGLVINP